MRIGGLVIVLATVSTIDFNVSPRAQVGLRLGGTAVQAEDWPQWMGPRRDNHWRQSGLLEVFPDDGPRRVWSAKIAGGYSGAAVAEGNVYVTDYLPKNQIDDPQFDANTFSGLERVWCLDRRSGKTIWMHAYPVNYGISYPAGPRCTPLVEGEKVYTLGAEGHLLCLETTTGRVRWRKHFAADYGAKTPTWGYAGHPLIDGDRLICIVGGSGSHVVAFDKHDGSELWRSLSSTLQGYVPPLIIEYGGQRQLILLHGDAMESVSIDDGQRYWSVPYQADYGSIIMTPIHVGNLLYAGGFNNRNLMVQLSETSPDARLLWQDQRQSALSAVNVQPFVADGIMYGFDQSGWMHAVDFASGKRLWQTTEPIDGGRPGKSATAFIIRQQAEPESQTSLADRYWLFNERGELLIANLTPEGYHEIDRAKVIQPTNSAYGREVVWSAPAWSDGQVFLRNDQEVICVELRAASADRLKK